MANSKPSPRNSSDSLHGLLDIGLHYRHLKSSLEGRTRQKLEGPARRIRIQACMQR